MSQLAVRNAEEEKIGEAKKKRELAPAEAEIWRMHTALRETHRQLLDSVSPMAQKALAATAAAHGFAAAEKMVMALEENPRIASQETVAQRTSEAMEQLRGMPNERAASTQVREVSRFAWSYYNEALGKEQAVVAENESVRQESVAKFSGYKPEHEKSADEGRPPPMAVRVEHEQRMARQEREAVKLVRAQLAKHEQEKKEGLLVALKVRKALHKKAEEIRLEKERGRKHPRMVAADVGADPLAEAQAARAVAVAGAKNSIGGIVEFALKKRVAETAAKGMGLLEVDEKRLAAAERQVDSRISEITTQIAFLAEGEKSGRRKASFDENERKKGKMKLRRLRKKLAFWKKAKGALRRLGGGALGALGKMLGGIFR